MIFSVFFSSFVFFSQISILSFSSPVWLTEVLPENFRENFQVMQEIEKGNFRQTSSLWVTSYNPDCRQTKGGVLGEDGICYSVFWRPCKFRPGKENCGNPCYGASGENLCTLRNKGIRPIAVGQDMPHLLGRTVIAECWKNGKRFDDPRCNGPFVVHDYKHKRYKKTVDIFMMSEDENIGAVEMVLKYPVSKEMAKR